MYEELTASGLTKAEARIYAALVELGKAQAGALSRKTGIHRRNVYDALERLIEKGFASFIRENNKRFYMASEPQKIIDSIDAKKEALLSVIPLLEQKFNAVKQKQETLFYKGVEGLKSVFDDQLNYREILAISPAFAAKAALPYYMKHYTNVRIKKKIMMKMIYTGGIRGKQMPMCEIRHLPKHYESPVSLNIYGDNAAIIVWGIEPAAILISNKEVARAFRNYFELMWKIAKK
ncbi:MAG: helix-turn-helix domain-containing protein [Candidatus Nanoarchaeia archaeon]|jgi:predicted DNA-binding transcriptional regulator